jgi:outer membrane protein assembly factor BamD
MFKKTIILTAFVAVAFLSVFTGCAGKGINADRNPGGLYNSAMELYLAHSFERAEEMLQVLVEEHPLSTYAVEAQLLLGDLYYASERYEEAASYYTNFVAMHPSHPRAAYAFFQKGMSNIKEVLTIDRDQTSTRVALFAFEDMVSEYPDSQYRHRADGYIVYLRKRLAERELYVGKFYFKGKNYVGALARFRDLLSDYPDTASAVEALYYTGESYLKLGEEILASEAFGTLIDNFPDSPFVEEARARLDGLG